jgi:LysM repeat protein
MNKALFYLIISALYVSIQMASAQRVTMQQTPVVTSEQEENIFYHTVERGQTVYSISLMYGVDEEDIYRLNPSSREVVKADEVIKIPQKDQSDMPQRANEEAYVYHTVQAGETLYGVSRQYGLSAENLSEANLGLTPQTFAVGKTIRIPAMKIQSLPATQTKVIVKELKYKIKRKETLYSISRKFNVASEELMAYNPQLKSGLKAGMELVIPVKTEEIVTEVSEQKELDINELINYREKINRTDVVKISLLLPFLKPDSRTPLDTRVVEFYEGFLMAVDSMRNIGVSVELYVYNIGNDLATMKTALENNELLNSNLLIGGVTDEQIELIADFARKNEIKYVIPFSSRCEKLTMNNPYIFQVNASPQNLYSYVTPRIRVMFPQHQIILLNTNDSDPKALFINVLKADLRDNRIPFKEITYNEKTFQADMLSVMSSANPNLIIPVSGSLDALLKIKGTLRSIVETKSIAVTLFGHPEWQSYTKDCLEDFYVLNTHFYSSSYMNNLTTEAKRFSDKYKSLYFKPLPSSSPKYAVLGYDLGIYFLTAVRTYGIDFDDYIQQMKYNSLQSGFRFGRVNNWGGFFNTNLYIIHYNKQNYSITREE